MSAEIVKLVSNLAQYTPPIKPVMRDSLNNRLSKRSKETNAEFEKTLNIAYNELSGEDFKGGVLDSLESYYRNRYKELSSDFLKILRRNQRIWIITLIFVVIGLAGMVSGIILVFSGNYSTGLLTMISGILCEFISISLFNLINIENRRLDNISKELNTLANTYAATGYIDQISDLKGKGEAIEDLIKTILPNEKHVA